MTILFCCHRSLFFSDAISLLFFLSSSVQIARKMKYVFIWCVILRMVDGDVCNVVLVYLLLLLLKIRSTFFHFVFYY